MQTFMQTGANQQRGAQHQRNKPTHAVPAVVMPEHAAERPGNTGTEIVAKQIKRRRLTFGPTGAWAYPTAGDRVGGEESRGEEQHSSKNQPQGGEERQQQAE